MVCRAPCSIAEKNLEKVKMRHSCRCLFICATSTIDEVKRRGFGFFVIAVVAVFSGMSVAVAAPPSAPWHLDRINQQSAPLDGNVDMGALTGAGVNVYIVDSGVRLTHEQFGGRVISGTDPVSRTQPLQAVDPRSSDCDGHGTHVAGIATGSSVGVARGANVIAVRVLNCEGVGTVENVVAALKWVRAHHVSGTAAVVNLSIGVDRNDDGAEIDAQVQELLAEGIVVTIAAGNGDGNGVPYDACEISPAHVAGALTVGASTQSDAVASYSNMGTCIDLFAPGGDSTSKVLSSWKNSDSDYGFDAGTSMASPLVAGYAALLAQQQPGLCAHQISDAIVQRATPNVLTGVNAVTPNRLLYIDTSPIAPSTPGVPTNVITSVSNGSVLASWDNPCDGGSPLTETKVSLLLKGKVVQTKTVAPGTRIVRFSNLRNDLQYRVVVQSSNALGVGVASPRWITPKVRRLGAGRTVAVSSIGRIGGGLSLSWKVNPVSKNVCKILKSPTRLQFMRVGTCRVELRTHTGATPVIHRLRVR